ncbi:DUF3618 domain-containing protein [Stackebrandtia soli]|uniref:DUF3618 domain-containing protein n=1 Tax=Stackebrandtia soli TaxID=1892856 RepID=UPI0039E936E8
MTMQRNRTESELEPDEETVARDLNQIRADIAVTRRELGDTVEALTAKMDVRARARDAVSGARHRFTSATEPVVGEVKHNRVPVLLGAAGVVAAVVILVWGRRR